MRKNVRLKNAILIVTCRRVG